jgi:hypothetical protein
MSLGVTGRPPAHSIGYVAFHRMQMLASGVQTLTRRRAVDFCRVATALCP